MRQKQFQRIAQDECCNWKNGGCIGGVFGDDLQHFDDKGKSRMTKRLPVCLITEEKCCAFFADVVLPGQKDSADLIAHYMARFRQETDFSHFRECPICGTKLQPKKRYCDSCRVKRAREMRRKWYWDEKQGQPLES